MADDTERMVIERPEHPLPDEIQNMNEEDTVCKFCGISYLIHREVARLKDELEKAQTEMHNMAVDIARFNVVKTELDEMTETFETTDALYKDLLIQHDKLINETAEIKQKSENASKKMSRERLLDQQKTDELRDKVKLFIEQQRAEILGIKEEHQVFIDEVRSTNHLTQEKLITGARSLASGIEKTLNDKHTEVTEKLEKQISEAADNLQKAQEEAARSKCELERVQKDLDFVSNKAKERDASFETAQAELSTSKVYCQELEAELKHKNIELSKLNKELAENR